MFYGYEMRTPRRLKLLVFGSASYCCCDGEHVCACVCVCVSSIRCLFVRKSEMKVNMTKWKRKVLPFAASIVCASKSPGSAFRRGLFLDVSGLEVCALGNLGRFLSCVCTLLVTSHIFPKSFVCTGVCRSRYGFSGPTIIGRKYQMVLLDFETISSSLFILRLSRHFEISGVPRIAP